MQFIDVLSVVKIVNLTFKKFFIFLLLSALYIFCFRRFSQKWLHLTKEMNKNQ